jgi:cytochrome c
MFDTMTVTKIVGGLCGTALVFLLGNMAAGALYGTGGEDHAGEEHFGYEIAAGDAAVSTEAAAAPAQDFMAVYASADVAAGEKVFGKCKACHKVDGADITGPHLNGVVDRQIASVGGFGYSDALGGKKDKSWSPEELNLWLESPKTFAPGTKMGFAGLAKVEDRANVIAYLATLK